ncbi:TRAP transporter substrate-binding protein DctP [Martelella mediterranea]|uniref:TRAP transporter substrate-binding protein DctP n=1 Tax=Martelella mediterranea TaxID=293089 RepID=UPI001E5A953E|nr:TRAP transporter substrate-binding protein DctP [Martelella mediterranea]MCD1634367.1 TRAP transporter substrate-binding protein DctP [Martelella mediterranea]
MRRLLLAGLSAVGLALSFTVATAEEVTLKAGVFIPPNASFGVPMDIFVDHVNEVGKGVLQIRLLGPEAIPGAEQPNAVISGVLDMAAVPPPYYKGMFVEADAVSLTDHTLAELRESDAYKMISDMAEEKMGVVYLTTYGGGITFHVYLNKDANSLDDVRGSRLRSQTIYKQIYDQLGVEGTNIPTPDVFTALERGVVEGYGWPLNGIGEMGWAPETKVRIDPGFYNVDVTVIMNEKSLEKLDDEQRKVLFDSVAWFDDYMVEWTEKALQDEIEFQKNAGIKTIDIGHEYVDLALEQYWADLEKQSPETIPAIRKALMK